MTIAWVIGLILSFLGIWFLKNSRVTVSWRNKTERPVLKMWVLLLLLIGAITPFINIIIGLATIVWWNISICDGDWEFTQKNHKLLQFLNKPIG